MLFNYKDFPVNRSLIKHLTIPKRLNYLLNLVYRSKLLQFTLLFSDRPFQFRCAERRERNSNTNDTNNLTENLRRSELEANSKQIRSKFGPNEFSPRFGANMLVLKLAVLLGRIPTKSQIRDRRFVGKSV